ncbi:response regulator transcription factor [Velocimicrobium porci]|uniref:Stage 0 sporulation protein A homolog n=1 Tax=Velocimicrobium porci TaxID=2606634 RepID=A0A6L5XWU5_9FIRM|nr:response regulator transcription factor [Velocimicrobium porci]MSS63306.1 response regulator transcription factor [Velocimicrobium porci]
MRKVVIVEDDKTLSEELAEFLSNNGYQAKSLFTYTVEAILAEKPEMILLDISLPTTDGLYLCREIRKDSDVPIIMITSKDTEITELMSMSQGADDFVAKPFHTQILLARLEAILKRVYKDEVKKDSMQLEGFVLERTKGVIRSKQGSAELTKNELRILICLAEQKNEIVSRDEIISFLWDNEMFVDDNTLTVNINRLRGKLEQIGIRGVIETKRGMGYLLRCDI